MDCKRFEEKLNACVDDRLPEDEIREFREHLDSCPHCARALEDLKKTKGLLGGLEEIEPPPWFEQKIMQSVRLEQEKKSVWQRLFQPLYIKLPVQALATALVVIIAIQVFRAVEPEVRTTIAPAPAPAPVTEQSAKKDSAVAPAAVEAKKKAPAAPVAAAPSEVKPARQESRQQLKAEAPAAVAERAGAAPAEPPARPAAAPSKQGIAGSMAAPSPSADYARAHDSYEANKMQAYRSRMEQADDAAVKGKKEQEETPASAKSYGAAVSRKKARATKPGAAVLAQSARSVLITINPHAPETAAGDITELLRKFAAANISAPAAGVITADVPAERLAEFSAQLARFGELRTVPAPSPASGTVEVSINIGPPSGKADEKAR